MRNKNKNKNNFTLLPPGWVIRRAGITSTRENECTDPDDPISAVETGEIISEFAESDVPGASRVDTTAMPRRDCTKMFLRLGWSRGPPYVIRSSSPGERDGSRIRALLSCQSNHYVISADPRGRACMQSQVYIVLFAASSTAAVAAMTAVVSKIFPMQQFHRCFLQ